MKSYVEIAKEMGVDHAAIMPVSEIVFVPEYRKFCEEDICGKYGIVDACPPNCGPVEAMEKKAKAYKHALVVQSIFEPKDMSDKAEHAAAKKRLNMMSDKIMDAMREAGEENVIMMAAGPWKNHSCISAYCADAQKIAEYVGMDCWVNDGKARYFNVILYGKV